MHGFIDVDREVDGQQASPIPARVEAFLFDGTGHGVAVDRVLQRIAHGEVYERIGAALADQRLIHDLRGGSCQGQTSG